MIRPRAVISSDDMEALAGRLRQGLADSSDSTRSMDVISSWP